MHRQDGRRHHRRPLPRLPQCASCRSPTHPSVARSHRAHVHVELHVEPLAQADSTHARQPWPLHETHGRPPLWSATGQGPRPPVTQDQMHVRQICEECARRAREGQAKGEKDGGRAE
eukprot:scaffold91847_cov33-Tisochrysis_lutea.AAC.3